MNTLLALALISAAAQPAPAWLAGDWEPYSNAFVGLRMLSIGKDTLSWKGCKDVHFDVLASKAIASWCAWLPAARARSTTSRRRAWTPFASPCVKTIATSA